MSASRTKKALRKLAEKNNFLSVLYNSTRIYKGYQLIYLDYRVNPVPRYGYGKPVHPEINAILAENDASYRETLSRFAADFTPDFLRIPLRQPKESTEPSWINNWLDGLDTFAIYGLAASRNAALHVEVGSGYSTKIVRRAIRDHKLRTRLVSIDPQPRAEIDRICDEVIRKPLEDADLRVLDQLGPGDTFFMDGSHRSFMNSDVTVFFLEILPRLKPGVLVHIHDIYLPLDYMPERAHWYYSEQYLLAASLLAGHKDYEVVLPNNYISVTPTVGGALNEFWARPELQGVPQYGCSFWLVKR